MSIHASARIALIAGIASGQGKTTVTAALARKLAKQGQRVRVFKTGPDFLDPMILEKASGQPVGTLDLWIVGKEACRRALAQAAAQADVILIEGVMGLYDGNPSSADLANEFGAPVVLALDAAAMAQTAGALVLGLRDYGPVTIAGVIANRVGSSMHADMIKESMRDVPLLGTLPKQMKSLPERHLGLVQAFEVEAIDELLDQWAEQLTLDEEAWEALPTVTFALIEDGEDESIENKPLAGKKIAVARDASFAFLYPVNLECLRAMGASLRFFSPLNNEPVPPEANALYLPGGYPELHAEPLSQAMRWRESVQAFHAQGRPILAECGGMMALAESLSDKEGRAWPMAGVLPGRVVMQSRLAGLGSQGWSTPWGELRGHTFHYSTLETSLAPVGHTVKHPSQRTGEAVYQDQGLTASYFHAYFPSCPAAVAALLQGERS